MANLVTLTKDNFKKTIEENNFVIVDFWAPWCEPCVNFTPVFEAAAKKNKDIVFGMVDIEKDPEIGEIGAPALDEIIKWARDYDLSTVHDYYKREDNNQLN